MGRLEISIIILLASAIPALAQVDTLQLVEIGRIDAPAEITGLYVEVLDGDGPGPSGSADIILTTASHVHIYDGITYEEIWTSPELDHPRDLLFADINNDGFVDLSVKDTTNIRLFDPHNDTVIWTSPEIDTTYECYTIGKRNQDEWIDAVIVDLVQTDSNYDYDTAWVNIYDGPEFNHAAAIHEEYPRFDHWYDSHHSVVIEWPIAIEIYEMRETGDDPLLLVFSQYTQTDWEPTTGGTVTTGKVRAYDGIDGVLSYSQLIGRSMNIKRVRRDEFTLLFSLGFIGSSSNSREATSIRVSQCTPDSAIINVMWEGSWVPWEGPPPYWFGMSIIDDIDMTSGGEEFCYSVVKWMESGNDFAYLKSLEGNELWSNNDIYTISRIISGINLVVYDSQRMVLIGSESDLILLNGESGETVAVISGQGTPITGVADIDADSDDEILALDHADLYIYGLQQTAIDEVSALPNRPVVISSYPNPFNSSTTIEYRLPEAGPVVIEIYDLLGRNVGTLVNERQEAGDHRVIWDAGGHTSGVYFYRIVAGDLVETRRMVLLK